MVTDNKYKYSKAYFKILDIILSNPKETVFVICGGQGASKTISILELIIQSLLASEKEATILSSELSKMKRTVIRDYKKVCKDWGVIQHEENFNRSESKHDYPNGSYLDFLGADVVDVGKGFRRDILYINEADKMDIETAIQFISRAKLTIIDYNPDSHFWGDDFINANNFLRLTFEDNEFLSESEVKHILDYKVKGFHNPELPTETLFDESNIKNKYWANKWKVYGLGLVGSLDGVVFENWAVIDEVPKDAELVGYGLDFGFTHPSALTAVYLQRNNLILDEKVYRSGYTPTQLYDAMKEAGIPEDEDIVADCAMPSHIAELQSLGYTNMVKSKKGSDSIMFGIGKMQEFKILVTARSTNLQTEFKFYKWAKDQSGNFLGKPEDKFNHGIDGVRYVVQDVICGNGWMEIS